jgi:hypothetical protein
MTGAFTPFKIIVLTQQHSYSGGVFLHDQRLSDFLNDRREKNILMRTVKVERLDDPGIILEQMPHLLVRKSAIVLAFELPLSAPQRPRWFLMATKDRYPVHLVLSGMEVHGQVHVPRELDLLHLLVDTGESFLPITQVTVTIPSNPKLQLNLEAVMVNPLHILSIGELERKEQPEQEN